MKYVLGLTITETGYTPKIEESLRLDFLVLVNTERDYVRTGDDAIFYIVVMNMNVAIKVGNLLKTYEDRAMPNIELITPDESDIKRNLKLIPGDVQNMGGKFVLEHGGQKITKADMVKFSRAVGRSCLIRAIKRRENNVKELKEKYLHPPGIEWDFYGVAE
jgi:hypothetical protein